MLKTIAGLMLIVLFLSGCGKLQKTPDFYIDKAEKKIQAGKNAEALENVNKALEKEPRNKFYLWKRGQIEISLGKYEDAIKDTTKAIELDANSGEAYLFRGIAQKTLQQNDLAKKDFIKAKEIFIRKNNEAKVKVCENYLAGL